MSRTNSIEGVSETGAVERYRATPLRPAIWMTSVLVWATVVALILRVPTWASVFLCALTGTSFTFYLVSYIYLMARDREVLRAERYRVRADAGEGRGEGSGDTAWPPEQGGPMHIGPDNSRSVTGGTHAAAEQIAGGATRRMLEE
jgi:hypothetical protein